MTEAEVLRLAHSQEGQNILKMVKYSQETGRPPVGNVNLGLVIHLAAHGYIIMLAGCGAHLTIKGTEEILE